MHFEYFYGIALNWCLSFALDGNQCTPNNNNNTITTITTEKFEKFNQSLLLVCVLLHARHQISSNNIELPWYVKCVWCGMLIFARSFRSLPRKLVRETVNVWVFDCDEGKQQKQKKKNKITTTTATLNALNHLTSHTDCFVDILYEQKVIENTFFLYDLTWWRPTRWVCNEWECERIWIFQKKKNRLVSIFHRSKPNTHTPLTFE